MTTVINNVTIPTWRPHIRSQPVVTYQTDLTVEPATGIIRDGAGAIDGGWAIFRFAAADVANALALAQQWASENTALLLDTTGATIADYRSGIMAFPQNLTLALLNAAGIVSPTGIWQCQDLSEQLGTYPLTQAAGTSYIQRNPLVGGGECLYSLDSNLTNTNAIFRHNGALSGGICVRHLAYPAGTDDIIFGCSNGLGFTGANANAWSIGLEVTTNRWYWEQGNAVGHSRVYFGTPILGEWYQIHFVRDPAGTTVDIYVNGQLAANFPGLVVPAAGANANLSILGDNAFFMDGHVSNAWVAIGEEASADTIQAVARILMPTI